MSQFTTSLDGNSDKEGASKIPGQLKKDTLQNSPSIVKVNTLISLSLYFSLFNFLLLFILMSSFVQES